MARASEGKALTCRTVLKLAGFPCLPGSATGHSALQPGAAQDDNLCFESLLGQQVLGAPSPDTAFEMHYQGVPCMACTRL